MGYVGKLAGMKVCVVKDDEIILNEKTFNMVKLNFQSLGMVKTNKSCPFCGEKIHTEEEFFSIVHKGDCFMAIFGSHRKHEFHKSALELWNKREE